MCVCVSVFMCVSSYECEQHVSVLCLCAFFGSMYYDFGDLEFVVVQG